MSNDQDKLVSDLLADYGAPLPDDGFVAATLERIERAEEARRRAYAWRKKALYLGGGLGGLVAAFQLPGLWALLQKAGAGLPSLETGFVFWPGLMMLMGIGAILFSASTLIGEEL